MADPPAAAPTISSSAGPSRTSSRHDMEGVGKFKLSNAAPRGNSYKAKFFVLKEAYDHVTSRREELRRELDVSNARLKTLQSENDLLVDAMSIVVPSQPTLFNILQQLEAESPSVSASATEMFAAGPHTRSLPPPPPPAYGPPELADPLQHVPEQIVDSASLNGSGHADDYRDHAPVHFANGRAARQREELDRERAEADEVMPDDDAQHSDPEHTRDQPIPPSDTNGR